MHKGFAIPMLAILLVSNCGRQTPASSNNTSNPTSHLCSLEFSLPSNFALQPNEVPFSFSGEQFCAWNADGGRSQIFTSLSCSDVSSESRFAIINAYEVQWTKGPPDCPGVEEYFDDHPTAAARLAELQRRPNTGVLIFNIERSDPISWRFAAGFAKQRLGLPLIATFFDDREAKVFVDLSGSPWGQSVCDAVEVQLPSLAGVDGGDVRTTCFDVH